MLPPTIAAAPSAGPAVAVLVAASLILLVVLLALAAILLPRVLRRGRKEDVADRTPPTGPDPWEEAGRRARGE
jgi:cell division septation protein DedD